MSQVVVSISAVNIADSVTAGSAAVSKPSTDVLILGTILAVLQVLDGVLTASGVSFFGMQAEGNMLIRVAMEQLGAIPALVLLKSIAILIVGLLCGLASTVTWVPKALKVVILIYVFAAIIPWTWLHLTHI